MVKNRVRIISGIWKGRKLQFPEDEGVRPTLGRARETLFAWLTGVIEHAACLDLYAGSGSLGYEALSRGAKTVVFVDSNKRVIQQLQKNNNILDAKLRATARLSSAKRFLEASKTKWDIIFLDPPYKSTEFDSSLKLIAERNLLENGGLIYFERPLKTELSFGTNWEVLKKAKAGDSQYGLITLSQEKRSGDLYAGQSTDNINATVKE
tara:strand:- start:2083 stop:2706 length:624 start_codon:yes stop_codon:yes gene_type:complete